MIHVKRSLFGGDPTQLTPERSALQRAVTHRAWDHTEPGATMLPDCIAALAYESAHRFMAESSGFCCFSRGGTKLRRRFERVADAPNDTVRRQDAPRHVLYDLFVVLKLALVMRQDRGCDLPN